MEGVWRTRGEGTGVGDHFGTIWHISINIDGTSPKFLWWIALVIIYKPTRFWVQTHQGAQGWWAKKS